jgi:hypothetical protein
MTIHRYKFRCPQCGNREIHESSTDAVGICGAPGAHPEDKKKPAAQRRACTFRFDRESSRKAVRALFYMDDQAVASFDADEP